MTAIRNTPGGRYLIKHSVIVAGMRTSVSLETDFWSELKRIHRDYKADRPDLTLSDLVSEIDLVRGRANLSSAVRLFVLRDLRSKAYPVSNASAAPACPNPHPDAAGHVAAAPGATRGPRRVLVEAE